LGNDIAQAQSEVEAFLPWVQSMDPARRDVLVMMAFNLGLGGLMEFTQMLHFAEQKNWEGARAEMLASKWASQVGDRAKRLAGQMLTGERDATDIPIDPALGDAGE
jgi:lysozyme